MQLQQHIRWQVFETPSALTHTACAAIVDSASLAIAARGRFTVVLAGGSTPKAIYQLLREAQTDWSKWHVYFGDERCLPPAHADRNSLMATESLLRHVPIPAAQIHAMPSEQGPEAAAMAYSQLLQDAGTFDLVLLGMGEDAHTASLFPGLPWEAANAAPAIPVYGAPKPPAERVSLSASRLSDAARVIFLVTGVGKQEAVSQWRAGEDVPVAAIRPKAGVEVFLDTAAEPESD